MADPFVGEIRMFGGNYAPEGWAFCNGQSLSISDYEVLFQLIGTTYGGDGQTSFNVPNLQGRLPVHPGSGYPLAQLAGAETVTLVSNQLPSHNHPYQGTTAAAGVTGPAGAVPAAGNTIYKSGTVVPSAALAQQSIAPAGGNQPHDNMMPYLAVSFIISLFGLYPSQN